MPRNGCYKSLMEIPTINVHVAVADFHRVFFFVVSCGACTENFHDIFDVL